MLIYRYADQLSAEPKLRDSMFGDRTAQFRDRLGWAVSVDDRGHERDEYDSLDPLYLIWRQADGSHGGSMRFLPTTGRVMVNEHFLHLTAGVHIASPLIWECTRFCLAPGAGRGIASALMQGAAEMGLRFRLTHSVGVFDARMERVYHALGWPPSVVGTDGCGRQAVSVGLWGFSEAVRERLARRSALPAAQIAAWFEASFDQNRGAIAAE